MAGNVLQEVDIVIHREAIPLSRVIVADHADRNARPAGRGTNHVLSPLQRNPGLKASITNGSSNAIHGDCLRIAGAQDPYLQGAPPLDAVMFRQNIPIDW